MQLVSDLVITFENNKDYFVTCTTTYNNDVYAYLLDLSDEDNHLYVKQIKTNNTNELKLEIIVNKDIINKISPLLYNAIN